MGHELVIRAKVVQGAAFRNVCIGIDGGRISAVQPELTGRAEFDFADYLAMPGGVDIHTHMREPGLDHKENFRSGTRAAAFGGTTTVMDMPNTVPATSTLAALEEKLEIVSQGANVDFGLFGQLGDVDEIQRMSKLAIGFKLFMSETTAAKGSASPPEILLNSRHIAGRVVTVHAEDPALFGREDCTDLHQHNLVRNMRSESEAVRKMLSIDTPARLNFAHLTTADCVDMARKKKASFEITPHHALLDEAMNLGAKGKVNPPLRKRGIADRLFDVLRTGRAIVASDHAPHTEAEKASEFRIAPSGMPGVETRVPLLMALAQKNVLKFAAVQDMCCQLPADLFGLRKGRLQPGYDADIAFYDLSKVVKVRGADLHSKCGWTAFEGYDAIFPVGVMLRGSMIIRGGQLAIERAGRNLKN
jgi:dihydroorotase